MRWSAGRPAAILAMVMLLAGCASYYSHYAMFPAENSRGQPRDVRVSWESADYPGWWFAADQTTALTVETQCSERVWKLRDGSHDGAGDCATGIRACGDPALDRRVPGGQAVSGKKACMLVTPAGTGTRIADIDGQLALRVSCEPVTDTKGQGDEAVNMDYLRASTVPYTIYSRKVPRGSLVDRMPEFDDTPCDAE